MKILYFEEIESTNVLAKKEAEPWTVIVAKKQTNGYGKDKNNGSWFSPRGGLYFTIILPELDVSQLEILTIIAGSAISKAINQTFPLQSFIKLPNDVYINNKKIAGVLIENVVSANRVKHSVVGMGVNTNIKIFPEDLKNRATSLEIESNKAVDNKKILESILSNFKQFFSIYEIR